MNLTIYYRILLSTLLLSSCTKLVPKYNKPNIHVPTSWRVHDEKTKKTHVKANTVAWWKKFNDPKLNQLISDALAHNNDLGMATGNLLQARASLQKVHASWLPNLAAGGTAFTSKVSDINVQSNGSPLPGFNQSNAIPFEGYLAGFIPTYTLNIMMQYELGKAEHLNVAMQEAAIDAVRLGVISQVAGSYFSLLGFKQQLALQKQMVSDAKSLRNYIGIQYKNGAISQENLAALDQLVASLSKKLPMLQHNITRLENALSVLINKNPGSIFTDNHFVNINTQGIVPINLPSEILKTRPDIAMADYQFQISHTMIGVAASQFFPSITLTGLLGNTSIEFLKFIHLSSGLALGQVVAGMPLVDLGIYADIAKAKGKKYTACYNYIKTVRNAFADVDNALSQHSTVNQSYAQQLIALQKAKEQYDIAHQQYSQGMISYSETIAYKLNVDYMEALLNDCKMRQMLSIVNLYQVLGGGYFA